MFYLHNDIVSVVANSDHSHNGAGSEDASKTSVEPTCCGATKVNLSSVQSYFQITEGSPHPISLGEGVDDDWQPHGGHHTQVREGKVYHEHVGRSSEGFDLEEYVADTPIAKEVNGPEEEEADTNNMVDQRMLWGKLAPVLVNHLQSLLVHTVKVRSSCSSFVRRQTLLLKFDQPCGYTKL